MTKSEKTERLLVVVWFIVVCVLISLVMADCAKTVVVPEIIIPIEIPTDEQPPAPGQDTDPQPVVPAPSPKIIVIPPLIPTPIEPEVPAVVPDPTPKPPCCAPVKVLVFTAEWCSACRVAKPTITKAIQAGLNVEVIDIDESPSLAAQYNITAVPTFIITVGTKTDKTNDVSAVAALIPE